MFEIFHFGWVRVNGAMVLKLLGSSCLFEESMQNLRPFVHFLRVEKFVVDHRWVVVVVGRVVSKWILVFGLGSKLNNI